jgi:hypothetical protein
MSQQYIETLQQLPKVKTESASKKTWGRGLFKSTCSKQGVSNTNTQSKEGDAATSKPVSNSLAYYFDPDTKVPNFY